MGDVGLDDVPALPPYGHDRVATLRAELTEWGRAHDTAALEDAKAYRIESVVIDDPRLFQPRCLRDVHARSLGQGIHRGKGFLWLPTRDKPQPLWNQTAGDVGLETVNDRKIAALQDDGLNLSPDERTEMRRRLRAFSPDLGDRRCRPTVIGDAHGLEKLAETVRGCFCKPEEIAHWKAGGGFDDPQLTGVARVS